MADDPKPLVPWWEPFIWLLVVFVIFFALALWAAGQRVPATPGPMPPPPALTPRVKLVKREVAGTNVVVCYSNLLTHGVTCVTNPPPPPPPRTKMTLAWTEPGYFTGSPFGLAWTNHLLWSTNGPNGPWTGDVPVICTNSNMVANINFDAKVKQMLFRLGTNSF